MVPIPASEHQLCQFVACLAIEKISHSTIKCYLSAIRHLHVAVGLGDPRICDMARLEQVLREVKSTQAKEKRNPKARLPISIDLLHKLKRVWETKASEDAIMLWAAASLCFFGFLRSGEITVPSDSAYDEGAHLSFEDISVDCIENPQVLKVRIKASKTDPFRMGVDVYVGRTNCSLCPVAAVLAYMAMKGPKPGPLFTFSDKKPLTRARFVLKVKEELSEAGVVSTPYSGHSFRSGAATTASERGISDATIKALGRWRSNAYQLYIKTSQEHLGHVSQLLAGSKNRN